MDTQTRDRLQALRDLLSSRLQELQADIQTAWASEADCDASGALSEVRDRKDDAARSQVFNVADAAEQLDREEIQQIQKALQRLKSGSYGACERCGGDIALERLLVQPATQRCVVCQKWLEANLRRRLPT